MPTHHQGPAAEIGALDAYLKLMRAADSVTTRVHEILPAGLTATQFAVLEALFHLGPLCLSQIAAKLLKSTGNLTLVVANLEKADWVHSQRDCADRRFVTVRLTPRGQKLIARIFPKIATRVTAEFSALSSPEQRKLGQLCKKLGLAKKSAVSK